MNQDMTTNVVRHQHQHHPHRHERFPVPREALGIGYEEWATTMMHQADPNTPIPEIEDEHSRTDGFIMLAVMFLLFFFLWAFPQVTEPNNPSPEDVMAHCLRP